MQFLVFCKRQAEVSLLALLAHCWRHTQLRHDSEHRIPLHERPVTRFKEHQATHDAMPCSPLKSVRLLLRTGGTWQDPAVTPAEL